MTLKEIPSNCGNLHNSAFYIRCFPNAELLADDLAKRQAGVPANALFALVGWKLISRLAFVKAEWRPSESRNG